MPLVSHPTRTPKMPAANRWAVAHWSRERVRRLASSTVSRKQSTGIGVRFEWSIGPRQSVIRGLGKSKFCGMRASHRPVTRLAIKSSAALMIGCLPSRERRSYGEGYPPGGVPKRKNEPNKSCGINKS